MSMATLSCRCIRGAGGSDLSGEFVRVARRLVRARCCIGGRAADRAQDRAYDIPDRGFIDPTQTEVSCGLHGNRRDDARREVVRWQRETARCLCCRKVLTQEKKNRIAEDRDM